MGYGESELTLCTELKELRLFKQLWQWEPTCGLGAMQLFWSLKLFPLLL